MYIAWFSLFHSFMTPYIYTIPLALEASIRPAASLRCHHYRRISRPPRDVTGIPRRISRSGVNNGQSRPYGQVEVTVLVGSRDRTSKERFRISLDACLIVLVCLLHSNGMMIFELPSLHNGA